MAAGVESSSSAEEGNPVAPAIMDDSASFSNSSPRLPPRLRRRLLECKTSPRSTVEDIQARLRDADLRRQQYYEKLSSKARQKPRSPSRSSSSEEDLGQRLEAKLQAAEQKRLSILAKAQMRLARLDELRQAAKSGVQLRHEKEREKLGSKVESRVQQAEANRMLMLKAYKQRRATLKERSSQSLLRRMARDSKYKERVRAAIQQKRAAAEMKRLGLLEAEKKRARARMLQVRRVAKSVSHQREVERRRMRDQLEDRLQRAKRQRAEYLRQRGRLHGSGHAKWNKQADHLSRKLARCWRRFLGLRRTTLALTKAYDALKINELSVKSLPFEQLAVLIESSATLQTVKALLDRIESRLKVSRAVSAANHPSILDNIDHLLKRVASPKRRATPRTSMRNQDVKKVGFVREAARSPDKLSRYPVRVVLCAFMILGHPDAVFSGQGEREIALAKSAEEFIREYELLIKIILEGPIQSFDEESDFKLQKRWTFRSQLAAFDKSWCSYLNCFVMWKVKDAQLLEKDLVRAACQLELSMIQTCKLTPGGESVALTHDMKAIQKQVTEDQKLLREKVKHLSGDAGIERMESALSETRFKYFQAKESGSPVDLPITQYISPSPPSSSSGPSSVATSEKSSNVAEGTERPSRVVRSLFKEDSTSLPRGFGFSANRSSLDSQLGSSDKKLVTENELIVNEFIHEQRHDSSDSLSVTDEDDNIKVKIRATMEKAFWDGIMESMKQDDPDYERVVQLMREVRDEICEIAPQSWKQEITDGIDIDVLSQVLKSGNLDIDYLGRILEFALVTLQKLSAPANDDEVKANHQKLLNELFEICQASDESKFSCVIAMIKGLRFVLGQIQDLKQEISKARLRIMEPLLKGPTGLDYLRNAFANRHGSPSDADTSLPLTVQWLSCILDCKDQEWEEHTNFLLPLTSSENSTQGFLPSTSLRTGGSFLLKTTGSPMTPPPPTSTGNQQPECKGEKVDLLVRLGLLKLVSGVEGLTQEALPETLMLNLSRLRSVQAQIQKIIVISTSILVCQQTLLSEAVITNPTDMENVLSKCVERLSDVLDRDKDAGIKEIVEIISKFPRDGDGMADTEKVQLRRAVMARMLAKSLQAGDPVFEKVSRAVYVAARGVVLGGSGPHGKKLAEMALRRVGAAVLMERVVEAAEVLVVAATMSVSVHGPWYTHLTS
ncbi:uncharacterized protein LOC132182231 isoform X1 [Corylus avellana]|uniref:uncharacterized protein LOC132182231 isoform X1 n=2 Tax=Corylus avellana TaxID=13451 RepID=UPI001E21AEA8|nr:uncharacterized protein LOC132182231 isoform X1 [Corylus avellana]